LALGELLVPKGFNFGFISSNDKIGSSNRSAQKAWLQFWINFSFSDVFTTYFVAKKQGFSGVGSCILSVTAGDLEIICRIRREPHTCTGPRDVSATVKDQVAEKLIKCS
jgi:hypothetical protein